MPENEKLVYLWLVVMGAPEEHWMNPSPESGEKMHSGLIASD